MTHPVTDPPLGPSQAHPSRWVAELMLDLCGYTDAIDVTRLTVALPSGAAQTFLLPILNRLVTSRPAQRPWSDLASCLHGWAVPDRRLGAWRHASTQALVAAGCPRLIADELSRTWLTADAGPSDRNPAVRADVVVGRSLDVGCYERGLGLLADGGALGFIGAGGWTRNEAGRRLRASIASRGFAVDALVVMSHGPGQATRADDDQTIVLLRRGPQHEVVLARTGTDFGPTDTESLLDWIDVGGAHLVTPTVTGTRVDRWPSTSAPWPAPPPAHPGAGPTGTASVTA